MSSSLLPPPLVLGLLLLLPPSQGPTPLGSHPRMSCGCVLFGGRGGGVVLFRVVCDCINVGVCGAVLGRANVVRSWIV